MQNKSIKGILLSLMCLSALGQQVSRTNKGFFVKEAGHRHKVDAGMVDKNIRALSAAQITALSQRNLIKVSKCTDGTYVIRQQGDLKGGGPVMGAILYWTTKILCYTGVTVAAAGVVAGAAASATATGGAAVGPMVAGASSAAGIIVKAGTAAALASIPATPVVLGAGAIGTVGIPLLGAGAAVSGISIAAAAAAAVPGVTVAAKAGTVAVSMGAAGQGVGIVAGIEAASLNAFAAGLLFPWF